MAASIKQGADIVFTCGRVQEVRFCCWKWARLNTKPTSTICCFWTLLKRNCYSSYCVELTIPKFLLLKVQRCEQIFVDTRVDFVFMEKHKQCLQSIQSIVPSVVQRTFRQTKALHNGPQAEVPAIETQYVSCDVVRVNNQPY